MSNGRLKHLLNHPDEAIKIYIIDGEGRRSGKKEVKSKEGSQGDRTHQVRLLRLLVLYSEPLPRYEFYTQTS
jgi:hypothetical protein